jgi:GH25 family lysozyme M1 (1,4-beta-N-acetylmuramidase)
MKKFIKEENFMARTPGIDVSHWQGEINWKLVAAQGYRFAAIRATVGNYHTDSRFYENWRGAREAGLLVSAYHVVKPKNTAESQITRLFDVLEDRVPDLPLVLDVELTDDQTPAVITGIVRECIQRIEQQAGRKPIIYTGAWFWNPNLLRGAEWANCDLWIANYGVENPGLPADWTAWRIWQYSDKGSVSGVSSHYTDLDWFNGSYEDLLAYANKPAEPVDRGLPIPTRDEDQPAGRRLQARVTNPTLRIRSGPGVQYEHVGDLKAGDVVDIQALEGDEVWVAIGPGQWVAFTFRGETYLALE